MKGNFDELFKKIQYVCVKVCDHVDLLASVKFSNNLAGKSEDTHVLLYVSKWEDVERLPYNETLFFDEDGEPVTEDEYEDSDGDEVYYESYWVYPDLELEPYLGDNGRNNVILVYQPNEDIIDKDFEERVKLLQAEFKPLDLQFRG